MMAHSNETESSGGIGLSNSHELKLTGGGVGGGGLKSEKFFNETAGNYVPIPQFYAGRSVFITGGTGFMGKVSI